MEEVRVHNKYFELVSRDGFNVPLKDTLFQEENYIALKEGDIIHVTKEGMWFLGIENGKDKFYLRKWLYFNSSQIYINSNLRTVKRASTIPHLFKDVTTKFNRGKLIDELLG